MRIVRADTPARLASVRELFVEYEAFLGFSLCFQGFEHELETLPGLYAPPGGSLQLAEDDAGLAAGTVALRPHVAGACEMKRLFVRPAFRSTGLGRRLVEAVIAEGRRLGYDAMVLDTLASLTSALTIYRSLGFAPTTPYNANPRADVLSMALKLR